MPGIPTHGIEYEEGRKLIGEIFVEMGLVTEAQVKEALQIQKEKGGPLGMILRDMGLVTDQDIQIALGKQVGMEPVDLKTLTVPPEVIAKVDRMVAETFCILPIAFEEATNTLTIALADPTNVIALDDLRFMLNCNLRGAVSNEADVRAAIEKYYSGSSGDSMSELLSQIGEGDMVEVAEGEEVDSASLEDLANQVPIIKLLNLVLLSAIRDHASDIHFEPYEDRFRIRHRIDGALIELQSPPKALSLALISRIKVMSNLNIAERRVPQDGKITMNLGGKQVDLRVSTLPTMFGESVVIRVLDKSVVALDINRLGMSEDVLNTFLELIHKPNGIILVTGPTGSGKTTTLYSCLNAINEVTDKIITTEDPVEYELPGIIQVPIRAEIGTTYASCLRAILRQDPDTILVGEIRDVETAGIAIEAALTGHLVFSTLHTQDAPGTVARLVEMGVEPFLLAATIEAIIAQRLVRCICLNCKKEYVPSEQEMYEIGLTPEDREGRVFYYGTGCDVCKKTGYKGRNAIYEIMRMNAPLRRQIIAGKSTEIIRNTAIENGMSTLRMSGLQKVFDGITTIEEVVRETLAIE